MILIDYNDFLKDPEKYLLKGASEGVLIMRNGYPYVNISKHISSDWEEFVKRYKGTTKIENLDPDDPFVQKYLNL